MASFLPVNNSASEDHAMDGAATPRAIPNGVPVTPDDSSTTEQIPDGASQYSRGSDASSRTTLTHVRTPSMSDEPMHDSEGEQDESDRDQDLGSNGPPSKKKKGQRFFCTDFPPCNLSFTRSEHLARHIRKHTGERPFQCHCSRRFSRLDNLRQHAQTVHVNEEIPGDSLAATGTRFQRQVRTDRVRPPGRARAGTAGSISGHTRGHSRNLSTSSIASTTSTFSQPPELRRRPPPLIMANDPAARSRLAMDSIGEPPTTPPAQARGGPGPSTTGSPYTPSNMFAATGGSPQFASPMSGVAHGFWDGKTAARRLSVPSSSNPFLAQHGNVYPPAYQALAGAPYTNAAGVFASPTSTHYPVSRDESTLSAAEAEMRRRTWHPSSYTGFPRPGTSGLNQYHTPDNAPPSFGGNGPTEHPPRLPGIESFDKVVSQQRPLTPPTRKASPMQLDGHHRPLPNTAFGSGFNYTQPTYRPAPPISGPGHRRGHVSWDMSLHHNLTGLDIRDRRPSTASASQWSQQTLAELQNVSSRPSSSYQPSFGPTAERSPEDYRGHRSSLSTGSRTRTSPEDSSSSEGVHTPSTASLEYHPAIVHSSGYIESNDSSLSSDHPPPMCGRHSSNVDGYEAHNDRDPRSEVFSESHARVSGMGRLEALVAVATSENKGAAKLFL
ncbi:C2H2 transcription factor [Penicillium paradoxum]|uniref:C2H2 transcription factor n=1 Tax=Penicillium paradoxum TaxID=176176 RepID=UPI0025499C10|nr:C2H2 transcription factor [Penicillium paradoxum]KAJ5773564.1 C2H2 transcription factor [Penicillium paradoxum]